jgi:hypothetical protein
LIAQIMPSTLRLRLAEQGASTSNSIHALPSREPLHDSIGAMAMDLHPRRARSEATTSCSARPQNPPPRCARMSPESQLSRESSLYWSRRQGLPIPN